MARVATAVAATLIQRPDTVSAGAALQSMEEHTRAIAEVADELRPLITQAQRMPAFVAVLMDSFDEAMRITTEKGIDVERALQNGAETALRFGATMDTETVRELR